MAKDYAKIGFELVQYALSSGLLTEDDERFINTLNLIFVKHLDNTRSAYQLENFIEKSDDQYFEGAFPTHQLEHAASLYRLGLTDESLYHYQNVLDSVLLIRDKNQVDSNMIVVAAQSAFNITYTPDEKIELGNIALDYTSEDSKFIRQKINLMNDLSFVYIHTNEINKYEIMYQEAVQLSKVHNHQDLLTDLLLHRSAYFIMLDNADKVKSTLEQINRLIQSDEKIKRTYFESFGMSLASHFWSEGDVPNAIAAIKKVTSYYESVGYRDFDQKWQLLTQLGEYYGGSDLDSSMFFFDQAVQLLNEPLINPDYKAFLTYTDMGNVYGWHNRPLDAIRSFDRAMSFVHKDEIQNIPQQLIDQYKIILYLWRYNYTPNENIEAK